MSMQHIITSLSPLIWIWVLAKKNTSWIKKLLYYNWFWNLTLNLTTQNIFAFFKDSMAKILSDINTI